MTAYAELAVTTNFSFLRGASHPQEMVATADELGLTAIGIADRNSFAGVVRAFDEWKRLTKERQAALDTRRDTNGSANGQDQKTIKLLVGTRLVTIDGFEVIAYPTDRHAYGRLCHLLSACNRKLKKGEKGEWRLTFEDILAATEGQMLIVMPPQEPSAAFTERLAMLAQAAPGRRPLAPVHR